MYYFNKYFYKSIFIIVLFSINIFSSGNLRFYYDYCNFKYSENRINLEIDYCFYYKDLKFIKTDSVFETDGVISIDFFDIRNGKDFQDQFKVPSKMHDTTGYYLKSLQGKFNVLLDSGKYKMKITAYDLNNPENQFSDSVPLMIVYRFPEGKFSMSGIQLCSDIESSNDTESIFYKNHLEVDPNPVGWFGSNMPALYYYFELYDLNLNSPSEVYDVLVQIKDTSNNITYKTIDRKYTITSNSKVEFGFFNIMDLKNGSYHLYAKVTNENIPAAIYNQKIFHIYNPDTTSASFSDKDYLLSAYVSYPEEQLDQEFSYAEYIASEAEKTQFKIIKDLDAKRKFMFNFWKNKDITKNEYFSRINFTNEKFAYNFKEGFFSDRGRVYCTYGKPDDIEKYPFEPDTRAYEIWQFDKIQGGVQFVFVDMSNDGGDYRLVHSTARGEFRNDNWQDKITIIR